MPAEARPASHDEVGEFVRKTLGLSARPTGCPLAPLYADAPPLAHRVVTGLGGMEDGLSDAHAFPGGVTAVDVAGLAVVRGGRRACDASERAYQEKRRAEDELRRRAGGRTT